MLALGLQVLHEVIELLLADGHTVNRFDCFAGIGVGFGFLVGFFCSQCGNVSEETECRICRDPRRDPAQICVVEESKDVIAIERTREFRGKYHVLGGAISPIDGIGPEQLRIRELMVRLADAGIVEVILATDPNLEGEATATYLSRLIKPMEIKVSRLASGLPVGGDLEYADEVTLGRAFEGRRDV